MKHTLALGVSLLMAWWSCSPPSMASDIHVPADQPSIQDAIDLALDGDRVLVAPGLYTESLRFHGKAIQVVATDGPATTIVQSPSGSVARFQDGEQRSTILEGFTLRGGDGDESMTPTRVGGGVFCWGSSPTLRGNWIVENRANQGGGCYARGPGGPLLESNRIEANSAEWVDLINAAFGAGVHLVESTTTLLDNDIADNRLIGGGSGAAGFCRGNTNTWIRNRIVRHEGAAAGISLGSYTNERFFDNEFRELRSTTDDLTGSGGALWAYQATLHLEGNHFEDCSADHLGGVLSFSNVSFVLDGNLFLRNTAARGGALHTSDSWGHLSDNVFAHNSARQGGGASISGGRVSVQGNTYVVNHGTESGGAISASHGISALRNELFWGNSSPLGPQIASSSGDLRIDHCLVEGGEDDVAHGGSLHWGLNNLDQNPRFVSLLHGDYRLQASSPCVDAGDATPVSSSHPVEGTDHGGNPRILDGKLVKAMTVDIGAFEFNHVHFAASGDFRPGGTILLDTSGTAGLKTLLWYGIQASEIVVAPYGTSFIDLTGFWRLRPFPDIPNQVQLTIPPSAPVGLSIVLQQLALQPGNGAGCFSNAVEFSID